MRTIKFRCWDTENKLDDGRNIMWYQDDQCITIGDCYRIGTREGNVLMQFTGLKDKNGKEIYEGDVLKLVVYNNIGKHSIRIVSFDKGCFGFIDNTGKFFPLGIIIGNKGNEKIFEVIGNIHSNPELLEATK